MKSSKMTLAEVCGPAPSASPLEREVTVYRNCRETEGTTRTLAQCLEQIRTDEHLATQIAKLRPLYWVAEELRLKVTDAKSKAAHHAAKVVYDDAKKQLPAMTLSGTFTPRSTEGLQSYSGVIQADFDHLKSKGFDVAELKARFSADPHANFVNVSPSGDGLKVGILVDSGPEDHTEAFLAMQRYWETTYGIKPDDQTKGVSWLCFLSSRPGSPHQCERRPARLAGVAGATRLCPPTPQTLRSPSRRSPLFDAAAQRAPQRHLSAHPAPPQRIGQRCAGQGNAPLGMPGRIANGRWSSDQTPTSGPLRSGQGANPA